MACGQLLANLYPRGDIPSKLRRSYCSSHLLSLRKGHNTWLCFGGSIYRAWEHYLTLNRVTEKASSFDSDPEKSGPCS